jgi:hypothetical protein
MSDNLNLPSGGVRDLARNPLDDGTMDRTVKFCRFEDLGTET